MEVARKNVFQNLKLIYNINIIGSNKNVSKELESLNFKRLINAINF